MMRHCLMRLMVRFHHFSSSILVMVTFSNWGKTWQGILHRLQIHHCHHHHLTQTLPLQALPVAVTPLTQMMTFCAGPT